MDKQQRIIKAKFKIYDIEEHMTEFYFYVNGKNILEYIYDSKEKWTTTGYLDDLMEYLRFTLSFIDNDEPFPYDYEANSAIELDEIARDFDTDDEEEFYKYYDKLNDWRWNHCWHHERAGAYIADVMFRKVGNNIEISWDSEHEGEHVLFTNPKGCVLVPCFEYFDTITDIISEYNQLWKENNANTEYKVILEYGNLPSKENIDVISQIIGCNFSEAKYLLEVGNQIIFRGSETEIAKDLDKLNNANIKYAKIPYEVKNG